MLACTAFDIKIKRSALNHSSLFKVLNEHINLKWFFRTVLLVFFLSSKSSGVYLQTYFGTTGIPYFQMEIGNSYCECEEMYLGTNPAIVEGVTFCPNGNFYYPNADGLWQMELATGAVTHIAPWPPGWVYDNTYIGFAAETDSTFYIILDPETDLMYWNISSNTITNLGPVGFIPWSDIGMAGGEYYAANIEGIWHIDVTNPSNSSLVVPYVPPYRFTSPSASIYCNTIVSIVSIVNGPEYLAYVNLLDGALTIICEVSESMSFLSTFHEFVPPAFCDNTVDLDCNDSSGAAEADFNSTEVSCSMRHAAVADEDVRLFYDAIISEMTITVSGFIPDGSNEVIDITGSVPGINATGQGTDILTLSNAGGAKSTDFIDALHFVQYMNTAFNPTAGLRTIEVQFTTESGSQSNVATAFIQVNELPPLDVDIGPDQIICEGDAATLDAGSFPGAMYLWSNGATTQSITTSNDGQYIVTVSDDSHCPGTDTAEVTTIPLITVALTGVTEVCDNQSATLTLNTNAPFPITVEIQADPGASFEFDDVVGNYSFIDLPQDNTTYTIISVTPSIEACIEITDDEHIIDVFPAYEDMVDVSICDGDSVWLGYFWETEAGVYENTFIANNGCDSIVTTTIHILPAIQIAIDTTTCSASEAGVFVTHLENPNGCDTVVTTTVTLLTLDTTYTFETTCVAAQGDVQQYVFTGSDGCDSIVIATTEYIPPVDTTYTFETSCDTSQGDVQQYVFTAVDGCDSIVVSTTTVVPLDTTFNFDTTCDSSMVDVMHYVFTSLEGCDSVVVTTTTFSLSDTTYLFATSCDLSDVGVLEDTLTGSNGCDSLVITTVSFAEQDSVFLTGTTCDPMQAGVTTEALINQFGCDSIVTTTVMLLPSDTTYLSDASCIPADTGTWIVHLANQHGCDSMVVTATSLYTIDTTYTFETTCDPTQGDVQQYVFTSVDGCDSIVVATTDVIPLDTTFTFEETCDPAQVDVVQYVYAGTDGCDSIVVETTTLYPLPILIVQSVIDYNGFDISCTDEPDGSAVAIITGTEPFTYLWSTTETDQMITGLSAGDYAVTITDGNGCTATEVITLEQPDELMMSLEVTEPDCFDQALGAITVNASGGVPPYSYAIDGGLFQDGSVFNALGDGVYQLTVMDANECSASEIIAIDVPLMVQVDLGDNQTISLGDSTLLEAIINLPFDSIANLAWTGLDTGACANCLTQIVAPVITTAYSVSLTSVDGCSDRDSVTIAVTREQQLYIPNIFSPNGDGINDVLAISADAGVRELSVMDIYDRWGNLVFRFEHKAPDDPTAHWDGNFNGQALNPGVYAYRVVVEYASGETEVRYGDVTLLR